MTAPTIASFFDLSTRDELVKMIQARHDATPRHLQIALGPSEIGHPCARRLALAHTNQPRCNPVWDPLASIIGVAMHAWLAEAAMLANATLGRERWLTEQKVHPAPWLSGSADLYDTDTDTVIDWKCPGVNQFGILKHEMSPIYRAQVHLYGRGFRVAGYDVKTVAVMLLPRGGTLASSHLWSESYDEALADATLERYERIADMVDSFEVDKHPERFQWFEKVGYQCMFCPQFSPRPNGPLECSGVEIPIPPGSYT